MSIDLARTIGCQREYDMARAIRIGVVLLILGLTIGGVYFFYGTETSEILVSDHMNEFIDTVDRHPAKNERKIIVFDLDDTVFMSSTLLGTPTWFYNMVNLLWQSGAAKYEAYGVVSAIDKIVQDKTPVVAVEQATLSAIRTWQELDVTVVGITSRHQDLSNITARQLNQISLNFNSPYFSCVENAWEEKSFVNGVLFAGNSANKGLIFARFLDRIRDCGLEIDLIANADDQQRYVTEIAKVAKKNRVDFIGIIYGGALVSREFNFSLAKEQLIDLEHRSKISIVPDEYRRIFIDESS